MAALVRLDEVGSEAVAQTLLTISEVTDLVGSNLFNLPFWPADSAFPGLVHYSEAGGDGYGDIISSGHEPHELGMRYVVRLGALGESTDSLVPAANAIQARFSSLLVAPAGFTVEAVVTEPWPQLSGFGTLSDGDTIYRQIGDFYSLTVFRQGA